MHRIRVNPLNDLVCMCTLQYMNQVIQFEKCKVRSALRKSPTLNIVYPWSPKLIIFCDIYIDWFIPVIDCPHETIHKSKSLNLRKYVLKTRIIGKTSLQRLLKTFMHVYIQILIAKLWDQIFLYIFFKNIFLFLQIGQVLKLKLEINKNRIINAFSYNWTKIRA